MTKAEFPQRPQPSDTAIARQLERIVASKDFQASPSQVAFLKFVVNQTLAGNAGQIKGYTVATQVFNRGADFDQNIDPIVSVQANKLRRALERYYLTAGKSDPLRIDIPKGTYVPRFDLQGLGEAAVNDELDHRSNTVSKTSWPLVLVRPFQILSNGQNYNHWGVGLAIELASELARYPDVRVLAIETETRKRTANHQDATDFEISGGVFSDGNSIKIIIQLTDIRTGVQIWSDSYCSAIATANLLSIQQEVAKIVASKVGSEFGVVSRAMMAGLKEKGPRSVQAYEAILRFHEYRLNFTSENFKSTFAALSDAVKGEPKCGQTWSLLGWLYAMIYALDIDGFENPIDTALEYAQRGVSLEPNDRRVRGILAYVYLFLNELNAGLLEVETALALNPNSLIFLDGLGYLMTLMGEWEHGTALINEVIQTTPYYGDFVHNALWVDGIRQGKYQEAYRETLQLNRSKLFWTHLSKAASLGLLGRIEKGKQAAGKLLALKPDFPERGRQLIKVYIKFDDIVDTVVDGLTKVGIDVTQ